MVNVTLENVDIRLGKRTIASSISTQLSSGEFIGIIGPNGAGKSTMLRAMLGLLPYRGTIALDGQYLHQIKRSNLAQLMAYLPQGQTLHWPLMVERLVALGRLPHLPPMAAPSHADHAAIEGALHKTGLQTLRHRTSTELSGGERARALLARALAVEAPILVADEPLAALDPGHQIEVMEMLRKEASEGGLVIAVLHDLSMAARYCDRVLLLDKGHLLADGAPESVLESALLESVYGVPMHIATIAGETMVIPLSRHKHL